MLQKFTQDDLQEYLAMSHEFYDSEATDHSVPQSHFEKTFQEIVNGSALARGWIVISDDGRKAGYFLASLSWSCEFGGRVAWLEELYLRPEFRGNGLGPKALREVLEIMAKEDQALGFRLEVAPANSKVAKIYESMGFKEVPYHQWWGTPETLSL